MVHPHRQRGEGAAVPLQPQEADKIQLVTKNTHFYRCTIESILSGCITACYGNCSAHNRKALQRLVRSAHRITAGKLPALQDTYTTRCHRKAKKIIKDNIIQKARSVQVHQSWDRETENSFYLKAIRLLNSHH